MNQQVSRARAICDLIKRMQGGYTSRQKVSATQTVYVIVSSTQVGKVVAIIRLSDHAPRFNWQRKILKQSLVQLSKSFHHNETVEQVMTWLEKKLRQVKQARRTESQDEA